MASTSSASAPISVVIATPCYASKMTTGYLTSLLGTCSLLEAAGIACQVDLLGNESLICRGRSIMAGRYLQGTTATHLFFVDADICWRPEDFLRVLRSGKDVCCGAYAKKSIDWGKVVSGDASEPAEARGLDYNLNQPIQHEGGLVQVSEAATGFMCISRTVLEALTTSLPELHCVNDITGTGIDSYTAVFHCLICPQSKRLLSEDYSFSRRVAAAGFSVWVDPSVPLTHVGIALDPSDVRLRFIARYVSPPSLPHDGLGQELGAHADGDGNDGQPGQVQPAAGDVDQARN